METADLTRKTSAALFAAILAAKTKRGESKPDGSVTAIEFAKSNGISPVHARSILTAAHRAGDVSRVAWNENGHVKYVYRLNNGTIASVVSSRARGKQAEQ
jgi:hypothetical protein